MGRDQRRLAAIVSADVAGYSRLMGIDESRTLSDLKSHLQAVFDPKVSEYGGRTVKTTGDGLLLEFPSVVDALRCAVEVQRSMAERNAGVAADRRIDFRIGVNLGDIIIDGGDIFGDGVNVAARLQALADPGGICVSKVVRDQVLDKLSFNFEDLGARQVKNIARPVAAYRVNFGGVEGSPKRPTRALASKPFGRRMLASAIVVSVVGLLAWILPRFFTSVPESAPPVLSLALLPLKTPQGDAEAKRFAETFERYVATDLPRKREYGTLSVVSGQSLVPRANGGFDPQEVRRRLNVRYALEGDLTRDSGNNSIFLRVIDTASGSQLWSEHNVFQDSAVAIESAAAVRNLTTRLRNAMAGIEGRRVLATPTAKLSARELVLRAFETGGKDPSRNGLVEAKKLVDEALRIDPDLVPALVLRAALVNNQTDVDPQLDRERATREQEELTARAVRLDAEDPAAWNWRGVALMYLGRWDAALEANANATKLEPYETRWRMFRADILLHAGRPADALIAIDELLRLNPSSTTRVAEVACNAHMLMGHFDEAITLCERGSGVANSWAVNLVLAAAYAERGDLEKAAAAKANVLRIVPTLTIAELRAKDPSSAQSKALTEQYLYAGLRKAGFPEK